MAGSIKGITIEFRGDTTKLDKALRDINKETRSLDKELKQVDTALKFNPTNVELWRQKQELLTQKIDETKSKLDVLKQAQAQMDAEGVDKNSKEYRELQRQIIVTENQVKTFEGQLKQVGNVKLKALSNQIAEVGGKLEDAGRKLQPLSTAAAGVVGALGAMSYKAGTSADDLNTLSKVTGIGTEELQKYSYAADLVDVSVESIAKANRKLTKNAYAAANGSKSQAAAFDTLGVSVTDADGNLKDSEELFDDVVAALGSMEDETKRNALAQKLMGGAASELNPLIEDGGETYKSVAETLSKYDLDYVDQETLDKANEFNDSIDTMKLLGSVAFAQVGSQLSAYLAPALEKVTDLVGKFANWLANLDPKVLAIVGAIAAFVAGLAPLLILLGKLAFGVSSIINLASTLGVSIGALAGPVGIALAVIAALIAVGVLLYKNWDKIKAKAQELMKNIKIAWTKIKVDTITKFNAIKTAIANVWNAIKNTISTAINAVKTKISTAWSTIRTSTSNAWHKIKDAIVHPFQSAKEKIDGIISKIKGLFPISIGKLFNNLKLPHFSIAWSSKDFGKLGTINYPTGLNVSWYATGGIFDSPSVIGVGEAGPEAVVPLDKFWDKLDRMNAGETNIVININGANADPREIADEVKRTLIREVNNRRLVWQ